MKTENKVKQAKKPLEDIKVNVKVKIASLWVVIMILYIYNDFFSLFPPGALEEMMSGYMGPFPVTQLALLQSCVLMAIPTAMIFLSLTLKPIVNRWVNIIVSIIYIGVMVASVIGEWGFYYFMGVLEICANALIILLAFKWPKVKA
jgi:hypothetical protein